MAFRATIWADGVLRYAHQGGTLGTHIGRGPAAFEAYIRKLPIVDEWLDHTWAAGGAAFESTSRRLRFFDASDLACDLGLRRAYLAQARRLWRGWSLEWCENGIEDIGERAGVQFPYAYDGEEIEEPAWDGSGHTLLRWGAHCATCLDDIETLLWCGPRFLRSMQPDELPGYMPTSGAELDLDGRLLRYWSAPPVPALEVHFAQRWAGWRLERVDGVAIQAPWLTPSDLSAYFPSRQDH